jgi:Uma2 family endonuclease
MGIETLLSVEEYVALPVQERGCEYDEGRGIELTAHTHLDAKIQAKVTTSLSNFIDAAGLDMDIMGPTGYWLTPNVERVPDVSLIRRAKAEAMGEFHESVHGAPDVAIEIVSPYESATDLECKLGQYLAAGVLAVVVIYPDTRNVYVWRPSGKGLGLRADDALEIPELLPGFKMPIDELFPAAAPKP